MKSPGTDSNLVEVQHVSLLWAHDVVVHEGVEPETGARLNL